MEREYWWLVDKAASGWCCLIMQMKFQALNLQTRYRPTVIIKVDAETQQDFRLALDYHPE